MPDDIAAAFQHAATDDTAQCHCLDRRRKRILRRLDLKEFAEAPGTNPGIQEMPWDPMIDYRFMSHCTQQFMSIWRCPKPVIARLHGDAVAGGTILLCAAT